MQSIAEQFEVAGIDPAALVKNIDHLRAAMALVAAPLASLPPGRVCRAIREAAGVPRATVAVALDCGMNTVQRLEDELFASSRVLSDSEPFRRLLAVLLVHLWDHDPDELAAIRSYWAKRLTTGAEPEPSTAVRGDGELISEEAA